MGLFPSYPTFLWITGCKILFIVSDQIWKTDHTVAQRLIDENKLPYKSSHCLASMEKGKLHRCSAKLPSVF
ncbi:Hypothetical protein AKI40_0932 [Enterobacter sp. FY-07]|nr:Hypothetical protein AKI40_0932 [Enterobacter sp. FY-07]